MENQHSIEAQDAYSALLNKIEQEDRSSDTLDFQHGVRFSQSNNSEPARDQLIQVSDKEDMFAWKCVQASYAEAANK